MVGKGVASVRSPVTRLREHSFTVDHLSFCEAVLEEFGRTYEVPNLEVGILPHAFVSVGGFFSLICPLRNQLKELDLDFFSKNTDIQADHDELKVR